ncbi:MAG: hypothetical protein KAQ72_05160 [Desulfobacula sp.]|nr:hypothetical protein [Desulfobacula sp.]
MSEYQYYEFLAIDRPLTAEETSVLRSLSTRAQITPVSFTNEYNWGDFKGDPDKLMQWYFDAHVYVANWMTAVFMIRLPIDALPEETANAMKVPYILDFKAGRTHWVITWRLEESENYDRFGVESGQGWMARLAPVRDELLRGDIQSLYIGWLAAVTQGAVDADQTEPLSVGGLGDLTSSQQALAEYLEVDPDLLAGAGMGRTKFQPEAVSQKRKEKWIEELPEKEVRAIIKQILDGKGPQAERALKNRFTAWKRNLQKDMNKVPRRTVGTLWKNSKKAEKIRLEQEEHDRMREEIRRRKEREAYLKNLSKNYPKMWKSIEQTVRRGSGLAYDEACRSIVDIFDAHALTGNRSRFRQELEKFMAGNMRRKALIQRLIKAGVWKDT